MLNINYLKKNYFLSSLSLIILVGTLFLLLGCYDTNEKKITFFGGKIKNPKGEYVYLYKGIKAIDSAKLDANSKFKMEVDSIEIGLYTFKHGPEYQYLYLEPQDSLLIYLNTWGNFDESLIFSGKGSAKNNFLINLYLKQEKNDKEYRYNFKLNEQEFVKIIDEDIEKLIQLYDQLIESEEEEPSEFFDQLIKTGIYFPFYRFKENYAYRHQRAIKSKELTKLSPGFYNFRDKIDLNVESLHDYSPYISYIVTYLYNKAYAMSNETDNKIIELNFMKIVDDEIKIQSVKDKLFARGIWGSLTNDKLSQDDFQSIQDYFFDNCKDEYYLSELKKSIEQKEILVCGKELPKVTVHNLKGEEVVINNVVKGSNAVIYFWPKDLGRVELINESLAYYKKKYPDIVFIGIERNKNQKDWVSFIDKKELPIHTQYKIDKNSEAYAWFEGDMARTIILNKKGEVENGYLFFLENKSNINYYLKNLKNH